MLKQWSRRSYQSWRRWSSVIDTIKKTCTQRNCSRWEAENINSSQEHGGWWWTKENTNRTLWYGIWEDETFERWCRKHMCFALRLCYTTNQHCYVTHVCFWKTKWNEGKGTALWLTRHEMLVTRHIIFFASWSAFWCYLNKWRHIKYSKIDTLTYDRKKHLRRIVRS